LARLVREQLVRQRRRVVMAEIHHLVLLQLHMAVAVVALLRVKV
jgi:hypothetical protein